MARCHVVEVVQRDAAITVVIQDFEDLRLHFLILEHLTIDASGHELLVVYHAITVVVNLVHEVVPVNAEVFADLRAHHSLQLLARERAILVGVKTNELFLN